MRKRGSLDPLVCYPSGFKKCHTCKKELPLSDYWKGRKDKPWLKPDCKDCARAYHRQYIAIHPEKRRQYWEQSHVRMKRLIFEQYGNQCVRCKYNDIRVLQIDHKNCNGHKERKVLGPWALQNRVLKHPEDYQLLCANCHVLKTLKLGEYAYNKKYKDDN